METMEILTVCIAYSWGLGTLYTTGKIIADGGINNWYDWIGLPAAMLVSWPFFLGANS